MNAHVFTTSRHNINAHATTLLEMQHEDIMSFTSLEAVIKYDISQHGLPVVDGKASVNPTYGGYGDGR